MGSASREALTAAKSRLDGSVGPATGVELLQAAAQIGNAQALLAALSDPSAPAAGKTQVVERLFGGLSADARAVLAAAVSGRWSNQVEFLAGLEELGIRAEALSSPALSDELLAIRNLVDGSHDLELGLGSKLAGPEGKVAVLRTLLSGKVSPAALAVAEHLVSSPRGRRFRVALREAARVAADQGGSELATVTVAAPLSDAQQQRLAVLLAGLAGRAVKITTVVDPAVIGGVRIQLADDVIDGSVRARLDDLRLQMAA